MWLSLLLLSIHGCKAILHSYTYIATPMTFDDAKLHCAAEGAELAIIFTDLNRADAIALIPDGSDAPWIGLAKEGAQRGNKDIWSYPKLGNRACPHSYDEFGCGKCVLFWLNGEPQKESNDCTVFYDIDGGKVNNDVDCRERRPFICHNWDAGICGTEDWTCPRRGVNLQCGDQGLGGFCFCDRDATGDTKCVKNQYCSLLPRCTTNADCGSHQVCTPTSCCGFSHCSDLCPQFGVSSRRLVAEDEERARRRLEGEDCTTNFDDSDVCY